VRSNQLLTGFNVEAWEKLAEICQEYLKKGRLVYIEGRLQTDRYEVEGEVKYFTKVSASQVQWLDRRPERRIFWKHPLLKDPKTNKQKFISRG